MLTVRKDNKVTVYRRSLPAGVTVKTGRDAGKDVPAPNPIFRCRRCTHWSVSHSIDGKCYINFGRCPCTGVTRELPVELREQLDHLLEVSSS